MGENRRAPRYRSGELTRTPHRSSTVHSTGLLVPIRFNDFNYYLGNLLLAQRQGSTRKVLSQFCHGRVGEPWHDTDGHINGAPSLFVCGLVGSAEVFQITSEQKGNSALRQLWYPIGRRPDLEL